MSFFDISFDVNGGFFYLQSTSCKVSTSSWVSIQQLHIQVSFWEILTDPCLLKSSPKRYRVIQLHIVHHFTSSPELFHARFVSLGKTYLFQYHSIDKFVTTIKRDDEERHRCLQNSTDEITVPMQNSTDEITVRHIIWSSRHTSADNCKTLPWHTAFLLWNSL